MKRREFITLLGGTVPPFETAIWRSGATMYKRSLSLSTIGIAAFFALGPAWAAKKVPYPELKVEVSEAYKPDPAFEAMRKKLADAVAKKDAAALFALVGPTFVWTYQGGSVEEFDMGLGALDNFKVVFGFRAPGADQDGGVEDGPFWETLAAFAVDESYYQVSDGGNLVCAPVAAGVMDPTVEEQARKKVETEDEPAEWYFTLASTDVMKSPSDKGVPIARIGTIAMPVLSAYPTEQEGQPPAPVTHLEVLLPSGKSGWIPISAARPLNGSRLCYAKTRVGDWKIVAYDQSE